MTSERRRAAIRRHHPDVGGDPELLIAALEGAPFNEANARVVIVATTRGRLARTRRRATRWWNRRRNSGRFARPFDQPRTFDHQRRKQ
ncbi:hypothetical protein [Mycolicibacterium lacusdiani]|uniref:hypothetical protein n=1 Tax=Mycolicibacterium lacusdiani TaxID=2895283 RepID=UPI001F2219C2|nr:hypothetical protein [Mycolicibacterium lacusdiani]